jgi:glycosyltransferase involved in cell wall biosynthesis
MKALLISGIYKPDIGGPATYLPKLANQLLEEGNQVEIITLRDSKIEPRVEPWPIHYVVRDQNILVRVIKTTFLIALKSKRVDVVFANGLFQETALGLLLSNKKSIAKVVGDPVFERAKNHGKTNQNRNDFNNLKQTFTLRLQRLLIRWSLNHFSSITCPSLELHSIISSWGIYKPVIVIPNGVASVTENISNKEFDVITVSRLIRIKNIDKLIIACAKAKSKLAIVGDGPEEANLKKLAQQLNSNIVFFGQLDEAEVLNIISKSKIFCLLSDYEGLSFALLTAMAAGLPSIVSNTRGNTDVISDGVEGLVVNIDNQPEIENAISKLIGSKELSLHYGNAAKQKVSNLYDQKVQISKVIELMKVK